MSTNSPLRIVLCHPFEIFRDGIAQLLQNQLHCRIVSSHASPADAVLHAIESAADLLFIDLTYLDAEACLPVLRRAQRLGMPARVVLLASARQLRLLEQFFPEGVGGCLLNTCSADVLLSMIRNRGGGGAPLPATVHGGGRKICALGGT